MSLPQSDRVQARQMMQWSPDLEERLAVYADLLTRWQSMINLVAPSTLGSIWVRHIADSMQVGNLLPEARIWLDLGSGAGFPGLVTAIGLVGHAGALVHLVESDKRKCAFLREVSRETGATTEIHAARIEAVVPALPGLIDAISARALAALPILMRYSEAFLLKGAKAAFMKGQFVADELTRLATDRRFAFELVQSKTEANGRIVMVRSITQAERREP